MSQQSKKDRAAAARQRAEEMRRAAEAKSRRTRTIIIAITTVVVVALVGTFGYFAYGSWQQQVEAAKGPEGLTERGGLLVGQDTATATVTEFVDFMCPACQQFEAQNGAALTQLKDEGKIKIEYVPVSILDRFSNGTKYSTRAASAGFCVMESNPEVYENFSMTLFENQPAENTEGLSNDELVSMAASVGVSEAGQQCIRDERYTGFATKVTENASTNDGLSSTPFILVNDEVVDRQGGETVFQALADAGVDVSAVTAQG